MNRFRLAAAALLTLASAAQAQPAPAPPIPSVDAAVFADFPTIPVDLATKPLVWLPRIAPAGESATGLCRDITGPINKPAGSNLYSLIAECPPSRIPGGDSLAAWARLAHDAQFRREGPNSFRFSASPFTEDPTNTKAKPFTAAMTFEFLSGRQPASTAQQIIPIDRTLFSLFESTGDAPTKGTLLFIPGMFGTPEGIIEGLSKRLRADGWAILRMWAHPARFTERMDFTLSAASPLAEQVAPWATEFDERAAETAYAAQAAFQHVFKLHPELATRARAAIGFSGGAMVLSSVLAREPGAYACAVMVGGGADFWIMNERSNYANMLRILQIKYDGFPDAEAAKLAANEAYLNASTLDSYHTARHIGSTKVLIIQGNQDRAVPSPLGDVLWERLGKPDRWLRAAGHEFLFAQLRNEYDAVVDWIRTSTPTAP